MGSIVLVALIGLMLVVMGLVGLLQGVRRSLLALVGTLLGAVLIDLWGDPLAGWLRNAIEISGAGIWTWVLVAVIFLVVALVIGYGSSALVPAANGKDQQPKLAFRERTLGGLIGVLNGTIITSYLLRYAVTFAPASTIAAMVEESTALAVLYNWLPWFVLALVGATAVAVLFRLVLRLFTPPRRTAPPPTATAIPGDNTQIKDAAGKSEAMQAVSNKIDQKLRETGQK